MRIFGLIRRLSRDERALAAIEYGLLLSLIVLAMVTALSSMANAVSATWTNVASQSEHAVANATAG